MNQEDKDRLAQQNRMEMNSMNWKAVSAAIKRVDGEISDLKKTDVDMHKLVASLSTQIVAMQTQINLLLAKSRGNGPTT